MASGIVRIPFDGGYPFFNGTVGVGPTGVSAPVTTASANIDSGIQMGDAAGCKDWEFQLIGTITAGTVSATVYGTTDPIAYQTWKNINPNQQFNTPMQMQIGNAIGRGNTTAVPASSWIVLPAPSEQSGAPTSTNPIVATGVILPYDLSMLYAVRVVLTTSATFSGSVQLLGSARPK